MSVFVLDRSAVPLTPCREKRARKLRSCAHVRVHRRMPFVIRLVDRQADSCAYQPQRIKLDPGNYVRRVAVLAISSFNIQTGSEIVQGISHKHCRIIQRSDGYGYSRIATSKGDAGAGHVARAVLSLPGRKPEVSRATA